MAFVKILQISPTFYPALHIGGGVPRVTYELSRKLAEYGHDVTVFTTDRFQNSDLNRNTPIYIDGVRTFYFRNYCELLARNKFYFSPTIVKHLKYEIQKIDIIHMQDFRSFQNMATYYYSKKFGKPYVLQPHGSLNSFSDRMRLKQGFDKACGNEILANASKLIALNETERDLCIRMGVSKRKIDTVPNGVNLLQFSNLPAEGGFRSAYGIPECDKIIMYIGRLHKTKGIDLLINSFYNISELCSNVWLVLIGPDYGFRNDIEHIITTLDLSDRVIIRGTVEDTEKIMALVDADIFVTPSFYGFPLTFLEACACGVPIITTCRGDRLDWIDNRVGYVVDYDQSKLTEAMLKVLLNKSIHSRFRAECNLIANDVFNWSKIASRYEEIYASVLNEI